MPIIRRSIDNWVDSFTALVLAASLNTLSLTTPSLAADRPLAGDQLKLTDPSQTAARSATFKALNDPAASPATLPDPREVGATLRIFGAQSGDGDSGSIDLPASRWRGLGSPAGSRGYQYDDPARGGGVRRVTIERTSAGGSVTVEGGGSSWSYQITQPQGAITLLLSVGSDTFCARFVNYRRNEVGRVKARNAAATASCAQAVCGNGVLDLGEECDDGNLTGGDGCSSQCAVDGAAGLCAGYPTAPGTAVALELVKSGFSEPLHLTAPPLDVRRLFVVEQGGRIKIIKDGATLSTPFLDISGLVSSGNEQGLLSLAFHPDYRSNGRFFVNYTNTSGNTVIARYNVDSGNPDLADNSSAKILLTITQPFANHNGGQLAFGADGFLYCGMGDGGSADDPDGNGQNDSTLLGKMLRLDVNVESSPYYAVPSSNPNAGAGAPLGLIWSKGLRNPWRFSFDRDDGSLYLADVGQAHFEEIDWRPGNSHGGENYGWDIFEAEECHEPPPGQSSCPSTNGFTMPVLSYSHSNGACSVTGGFVYRGCRMPELRGRYFYSDFCAAFLKSFVIQGGNLSGARDDSSASNGKLGSVTSFGEDARGEIYVINRGGQIYRIVPQ